MNEGTPGTRHSLLCHFQGREQAELTGLRLASLGLKFNKIVHSSMTRAVETSDIISKHLPGECGQARAPPSGGRDGERPRQGHPSLRSSAGVSTVSTDLLREGAPIEPDPPVSHWKPEAVVKCPPAAAAPPRPPPPAPRPPPLRRLALPPAVLRGRGPDRGRLPQLHPPGRHQAAGGQLRDLHLPRQRHPLHRVPVRGLTGATVSLSRPGGFSGGTSHGHVLVGTTQLPLLIPARVWAM